MLCTLCLQAYKGGLYGPHIVWGFINWLDNWVDLAESLTTCTPDQILETINQALYIGSPPVEPNDVPNVAERDFEELDAKYDEYFNYTNPEGKPYRMHTYDSVWEIALGLNKTAEILRANGV